MTDDDADGNMFAYGEGYVEDEYCPIASLECAVLEQQHPSDRMAGEYDTMVRRHIYENRLGDSDALTDSQIHQIADERGFFTGVIEEELAKQCWMNAISSLEEKEDEETSLVTVSEPGMMADDAAEYGRKVANQMGWA